MVMVPVPVSFSCPAVMLSSSALPATSRLDVGVSSDDTILAGIDSAWIFINPDVRVLRGVVELVAV